MIGWARRLLGAAAPRVSFAATYGPRPEAWEERLLHLARLCLEGSPLSRRTAELALWAELRAVPPSRWPRLDDRLRQWVEFVPDARAELPVAPGSAAVPLLACHHSGFVRERAVRALAAWRDGRELPSLLLRANDWVPEVRVAAKDALRDRMTPGYVPHWVRNLGLAAWLRRAGRANHRPLLDEILGLLGTGPGRARLLEALRAGGADTPWMHAAILFTGTGPGDHELVAWGLVNRDTRVRLSAAAAAERLDDNGFDRVVPLLWADPLPPVRALGIRLSAARPGFADAELFRRALLDRSAAVRAAARRALESMEPMDFGAFFRERLHADEPALPAVIDGLRTSGSRADADLVRPFVDHPRPRVRAAALRALGQFAAEDAEHMLLRAIADPNRSVSHAAVKLVRPRLSKVSVAALAPLFEESHPPHVRRAALSLLAARGKWIALPWLIRAAADADESIAWQADALLRRWRERFNRSFTHPTPEQRADALAALEGYDPARFERRPWYMGAVHPGMRDWLRYILETGG